jgi:hypothetical protein
MRLFALPAIVLAFSGGASAMKIPLGLAEGVYIASIDESGNQNFTRLPDAPVAPRFDALVARHSAALKKRVTNWPGGTQPVCGGEWYESSMYGPHLRHTLTSYI